MSVLSQYASTLVSGLITEFIPIDSMSLRMTAGLLTTECLKSVLKLKSNTYLNRLFSTDCLILDSSDKNTLYVKYEEYLVHKYFDQINQCSMIPKSGEFHVKLTANTFLSTLNDKFIYNHITYPIQIRFEASESNVKILITSTKCQLADLKRYVEFSTKSSLLKRNQLLTLYWSITIKPTKENKLEHSMTTWNVNYIKTPKTFANTICSQYVTKEFVDDLKWFIDNEEWYIQTGTPRKRGYLLYGPPGTGKTSIIKASANEYALDIYSINMDNISSSQDYTSLTNEINDFSQSQLHIVAYDDIDRCPLFNSTQKYYSNEDDQMSIGTFMTGLDGLADSYGRITIMTANNIEGILKHQALIRPGRIDKIIKVDACDSDQANRLFNLFYPQSNPIDPHQIQLQTGDTTAKLIQTFQTHFNQPDLAREYLYGLTNRLPSLEIMSNNLLQTDKTNVKLPPKRKGWSTLRKLKASLKKNNKVGNKFRKTQRKLKLKIDKETHKLSKKIK